MFSPKQMVSNQLLYDYPHIHPQTSKFKILRNQPMQLAHELELQNGGIGTLVGTQKLITSSIRKSTHVSGKEDGRRKSAQNQMGSDHNAGKPNELTT